MRRARPLKGHRFHTLTDDMLRFIIQDATEAARNMFGFDDRAEAKYLDQISDARTVLNFRKG